MEIVQKRINEITPYENNPRVNEKAVQYVAESISEFGFKVPIVIDGCGTIIAGHTRLLAAQQLGMEYVPCIVAADLSDDQARAYRLADNRVSEKSKWDMKKLDVELSRISSIDMKRFDFRLPKIRGAASVTAVPRELAAPETLQPEERDAGRDLGGYFGDERERTYNSVNLRSFDPYRAEGFYQMPIISACGCVPNDLIGFKYVKAQGAIPENTAVHFFIDDYQFERVWNNPRVYIGMLIDRGCECALTPDFSLYLDMPMAMKVWNVYRSRLIGQMMQDAGIRVIPTLQWAEPETFAFWTGSYGRVECEKTVCGFLKGDAVRLETDAERYFLSIWKIFKNTFALTLVKGGLGRIGQSGNGVGTVADNHSVYDDMGLAIPILAGFQAVFNAENLVVVLNAGKTVFDTHFQLLG